MATMQSNCKKLQLPFEVLIQGPTDNRFVRSLLYADPDAPNVCMKADTVRRKVRSTISIYRPNEENQEEKTLQSFEDKNLSENLSKSKIPTQKTTVLFSSDARDEIDAEISDIISKDGLDRLKEAQATFYDIGAVLHGESKGNKHNYFI